MGSPPQQVDDGELPHDATPPAETLVAASPYFSFTACVMLLGSVIVFLLNWKANQTIFA
jgi:hypothetical protein